MRIAVVVIAVLSACGDNRYLDEPYYAWNGATAVGAHSLDGIPADAIAIQREVAWAKSAHVVDLFYGHNPPTGTSYATIDALLTAADHADVPIYTFADLANDANRGAGICLSFDDTEVDAWFALRPLLAKHHAHVTFFVTEYASFTDAQRAELHQLYAEGNSIEAHGIHHLHADEYVAMYGEEAYIANEVQPSIDVLRADGFTPVAFAYPAGSHTESLDDKLASHIRFTRGISGRLK
jgi:peptidoglycan/xylan/chitin deacetylase (PgdA/CDA1 family)